MEVPEVAIKWMAQHASSNLDLASLSNVNRQWRRTVTATILSAKGTLLLPSMIKTILSETTGQDTFCAAWFHPAGIQIQRISGAEDVGEEDFEKFAPSGGQSYAGSEEGRSPRQINFDGVEGPLCSHEWRGYRDPLDVLGPFGYAAVFVENVLTLARERARQENSMQENGCDTLQEERHPTTTIAVRGATLARPEGYCLCWDAPDVELPPSCSKDSWEAVPHQDLFRSSLMRKKKRQILQREVLPRVVLSSKHKNPLNLGVDSTRQPCLQFLNASGSNAVRLFTPPFDCGPLEGPITLFLVGIATEDGCFVSGLKRRCELGHMHPLSFRDALIDMSPISIATDYRKRQRSTSPSESISRNRSYSEGSHADSDDSSCALDIDRDEGMQCKCQFSGSLVQDFAVLDDDGPPEECIYRGQRGPGLWHVYVVVFDKEDSVIRIDGAPEPLEKGCCQDPPAIATLDGLTIGSDHCFDMSLCLGDGNGDEGEGAIAELAVFKGRLCDEDILSMECHLLRKHGIVKPKASDVVSLVRDDDLRRQGRALIAQPPPWSMRVSGIPLPIMAQDRSVAWHRINAVTGKDMRVSRIGSKYSNGSSDW